jgi:hypothetical protein
VFPNQGVAILLTLCLHQVRNYLWRQQYILRFNEDGKKAKSKGNHIWNIEAKKTKDGKWEFRPFHRKLAGSPPSVAYCGLKWSWTSRIWDPQASWQNVPVEYSSPVLPSWLSWNDDTLSGTPPLDAESCRITVNAKVCLQRFTSLAETLKWSPLFLVCFGWPRRTSVTHLPSDNRSRVYN